MTLEPPPEDSESQLSRRSKGPALSLPLLIGVIALLAVAVYVASAVLTG